MFLKNYRNSFSLFSICNFILGAQFFAQGMLVHQPLIRFSDIQKLYIGSDDNQVRALVCDLFDPTPSELDFDGQHDNTQQRENLIQLIQDLNIFSLKSEKLELRSKSALSLINRTETVFGELLLAYILANPTCDGDIIQDRQSVVKEFLNDDLRESCKVILEGVKHHEKDILEAYRTPSELELKRINELFFHKNFLKFLNSNEYALLAIHIKDIAMVPMPFMIAPILKGTLLAFFGHKLLQFTVNSASNDLDTESIEILKKASDQMGDWRSHFKSLPSDVVKALNPRPHVQFIIDMIKDAYKQEWGSMGLRVATNFTSTGFYIVCMSSMYKNIMAEVKKAQSAKYIQGQLIHVARLVRAYDQLIDLSRSNAVLRRLVDSWRLTCAKNTQEFDKLLSLLRTATFEGEVASFLSHPGRVRAAYTLFQATKEQFADIMKLIGLFDAYRSIAVLYLEHEQTPNKYSFVEVVFQEAPLLDVQDFWNPFTSASSGVTNSIRFTTQKENNDSPRIAVVTGSNSGGKSTIMINGLGLVVFFAQTLGIAPGKVLLTLFKYIKSALKVHDDIAQNASHHVFETNIAAQITKSLEMMPQGDKAFIIVDELMEGTDAETGHQSLRIFVEGLIRSSQRGSYPPQAIAVIVTQHKELYGPTGLDQHYPDDCCNYKIEVRIAPDGSIERPHKVEKGISTVKVGGQLLQEAYNRYGVVNH